MVTVDEMLPYIGEFGTYQIIQMIMICFVHVAIILPAHHLSYFATLESPWRCIRNSSICLMNDTFTPEDSMYSKRCLLPRDSWTYTQNKAFSVITYFDLIVTLIGKGNWSSALSMLAGLLERLFRAGRQIDSVDVAYFSFPHVAHLLLRWFPPFRQMRGF